MIPPGPRRALVAGLIVLGSAYPSCAMAAARNVPRFDIEKSCANADAFSKDFQMKDGYRACLADEARARRRLTKIWSSYSAREKSQCLEPGPDPSYVETLTCLQLNGNRIGGPVAPGVKFD